MFYLGWIAVRYVQFAIRAPLVESRCWSLAAAVFIILGYLGVKAPTEGRTILTQICTALYFSYFFGIYFWTKIETTKPEPDRITMDGGMGFAKTLGAVLIVALMVSYTHQGSGCREQLLLRDDRL